jgi:phosphopentomutase
MTTTQRIFDRVVLIVLDGVGCGALPDAADYGDVGSNTLGHVAEGYPNLKLPNLARWGLGHLTPMPPIPPLPPGECVASYGRCRELSQGKDTTAGHWEMAGVVVEKAFATFPDGFPAEVVERWIKENGLPGVLGNRPASGTEIIRELGEEHLRSGKPILYTSADSVWQMRLTRSGSASSVSMPCAKARGGSAMSCKSRASSRGPLSARQRPIFSARTIARITRRLRPARR